MTTFFTSRFLKVLLDRYFRRRSRIIHVDPTQYSFLKHLVSAIIYILGIGLAVHTVPSLRSLSLSLFDGVY